MAEKKRIMYILRVFPQTSETYIKSEIEAVRGDYDLKVISMDEPDLPCDTDMPFERLTEPEPIREAIEDFKPHVLHAHWLKQIRLLSSLARETDTPFTIRSHSFDVLQGAGGSRRGLKALLGKKRSPYVEGAGPLANDELCLGILCFPFARPLLEDAGMKSEKIHESWPVVAFDRFFDRSANGEAVMNTGACLPKKKMDDFIELAAMTREMKFNLYPLGFDVDKISALNQSKGGPVQIMAPFHPNEMPFEYKKHRWLVYTASKEKGTVGWPVAVAEAQASGVGVCMPNLRPDLKEYVGEAG
ncbi:MAG: glycosyltransferase, partial [Acidimicrobiia bacterium]